MKIFCCLALSWICASELSAAEPGAWKPLDHETFEKLTFSDLPATSYEQKDGQLKIDVKQSAAAWVLAFPTARPLHALGFEWKSSVESLVPSAEAEETKAGDDAILRIGLLLAGPAPTVPFFAPAWIKAVKKLMKQGSDRMVYLTVGAKHKPGQEWKSPYASSIENRALASEAGADGWKKTIFKPEAPMQVVGLWLMSDGDNTKQSFQVELRNLTWE